MKKTFFVLLVLWLLVGVSFHPAMIKEAQAATDYYVDGATGDDGWPGTEAQPFKTITKAANTLVAGDTVYIKSGTYNEKVTPANSGSVGNWITYKAYPGHTVTIDGTGISLDFWNGLFHIENKDYIIIDNLDSGFDTFGSWTESGADGEYNGSSVYTATAGYSATWTPNITEAGTYEVYIWWTYHYSGRDTSAPYTINHKNGSDTVPVNQNVEVDAGEWYLLGAFEFDAGIGGNITLTREAEANGTTSADAIKVIRIGD